MIILLHGDDIEAIYREADRVVSGKKVETFDCSGENIEILARKFQSSLFSESKALIVKNISSVKGADLKKLLSGVSRADFDPIVLVETKHITQKGILSICDSQRLLTLPKYYFDFLDNFWPGNQKREIVTLHSLLTVSGGEQVFYSLIKRVRLLLIAKGQSRQQSADLKALAPWQIQRLKSQADKWERSRLLSCYSVLYDTEKDMKSGKMALPLEKCLDVMILSTLSKE